MSPDPRVARLQQTALFGATSDATVEFVLAEARVVEVEVGECFFREGERGNSVFWLERGRVAITKQRGGELAELRSLEAGDCFGEVALFDFGPRSASVRALEPSRALEITHGLLRELSQRDLEQYTLLTMNLGRELARRLRSYEERAIEAGAWDSERPTPAT